MLHLGEVTEQLSIKGLINYSAIARPKGFELVEYPTGEIIHILQELMGEYWLLLAIHVPYGGFLDVSVEALLGEGRHLADQTRQISFPQRVDVAVDQSC